MDNENNNVVEETARPVKKLVLKRKPVIKKTPKIKDAEGEQESATPITEVRTEEASSSLHHASSAWSAPSVNPLAARQSYRHPLFALPGARLFGRCAELG